jgi:hypothetical protein
LDYFGTVVNLAAKLQAVAEEGDIALPTDLAEDSLVLPLLNELNLPSRKAAYQPSPGMEEHSAIIFNVNSDDGLE